MNTRICPQCKLLTAEWYSNTAAWCKECHRAYCKQRHEDNYNNIPYRMRQLAQTVKQRAKAKNLYCDITTEELIDLYPEDGKCPVFNTDMVFGNGDYSPSLDRIDSAKGYTKDNCMFISKRANTIKSNATLNELKQLVAFLEDIN